MSTEIRTDQASDLHGVRGWLLALCLYLLVLIPALAVLGLIGAWQSAPSSPQLQAAVMLETVFELALAGFAFYAGFSLYRLRPNALPIAKVYFITILTLGLLGLGILVVASLRARSDAAFSNMLRGPAAFAGVREVVLSLAWLVYLERSRRVRATYAGAPAE